MAKKTKSHALALHRYPSQAKPIVIRTTKIVKKPRHHRRGGGGGGLFGGNRGHLMMGAFALGLIQKLDFVKNLPAIPVIGETGTIGLAAHFLGGRSGLARDVATVAFCVAAWELGNTGKVIGVDGETPDIDGYVAGY